MQSSKAHTAEETKGERAKGPGPSRQAPSPECTYRSTKRRLRGRAWLSIRKGRSECLTLLSRLIADVLLQLIPTLRSNEYFGRYGKITKILLVKRNASGGGPPVVGLYISYYRREDAARAIAEVDGTVFPSGGGDVMRASYGTTKYCIAFLRNVSCSNKGCMDLHDWGDEKDCFTKEDLTTLYVCIVLATNRFCCLADS